MRRNTDTENMHILYTGPVSLDILTSELPFAEVLHDDAFRFDMGSRLVLGFLARGHRVTVLKLTDCVRRDETRTCGNLTLKLFPGRPVREQYRHFYHHEVKTLARAIRETRPEVVFAQWTYEFARAALVSGYPALVVAHDSPWRILALMRDKARWLRTFYSQFLVFTKIKYLSAVSPYIVREMRRFNLYFRKVRCIPNAIPLAPGRVNTKTIRPRGKTVFCVTDWSRRKNPQALLRAFARLHPRHPDWTLKICGRGLSLDEEAGRFLRQEGLSPAGMELAGFKDHAWMDAVLRDEADVFISPTLEESFGLVFLEAMAQGVPCIGGARSGAVPWVLGAEDADGRPTPERAGGFLCDVRDSEQIAAALETVLEDEGLRRAYSRNGFRRAQTEFDMSLCVDRYLDALACVSRGGKGW